MNARKSLYTVMLGLLLAAIVLAGCAPAATPAPTAVPTKAPTVATTAAPTAVPFDIKSALNKYLAALPDGFGGIAPAALKDQLAAAKPFLLDVREAKELTDNGFIEGTVNVPIRALAQNLDKLPADKTAPIVAYCGSGHRSAIAMEALQMLGYTNVKSLSGGFTAWKTANMAVVTGAPTAPAAGAKPAADKDLLAALDKYLAALPDGFGGVAPAAVKDQMAAAKPFLLDVREAKELTDNGYLAGAENVPIRALVTDIAKLPTDKATPIIAYCGSGHRSAIAMEALQLLGYTNVKSMSGGFTAWKAANLPVTK